MVPPQQQPRAVRSSMTQVSCPTITPPSDDVPAPAKKQEEKRGAGKRRWTEKLRCKIIDAVRPSRRAAATKVEPRCDVDGLETKKLQRAIAQHQRRPRREATAEVGKQQQHCGVDVETKQRRLQRQSQQRSGGPALQKDSRIKDDDGSIQKVIKPAVTVTEESQSPTLVELLFPLGVLERSPKVPESSLKSVVAAAAAKSQQRAGSSTPVDRDVVDQRPHANAKETAEQRQARRPPRSLRWGENVSQSDEDGGVPETVNVNLNARPKKGILKVRSAIVTEPEEEKENPTPKLVELLFPTGFLSKPPQSFRSSGPEKGPAFLMSVIAAADAKKSKVAGSSRARMVVDHDLVDQWSEAKENSSRRSRYLREFCPFQRDDDEESAPATEETATLPPEPGTVEEEEVKTGLPFDSPAAEAEFVKAIVSRYMLKDDFINRCAFQRTFAQEQSLLRGQASAGGPGRNVTYRGL